MSVSKFPCPVCGAALTVRQSKKQKPYVVCDSCGVQMFVRAASGIARFQSLIAQGERSHSLDRLAEMERRYRKQCPECHKTFWINPVQAESNWFNGKLTGYRCPEKDCEGVVPLEDGK